MLRIIFENDNCLSRMMIIDDWWSRLICDSYNIRWLWSKFIMIIDHDDWIITMTGDNYGMMD